MSLPAPGSRKAPSSATAYEDPPDAYRVQPSLTARLCDMGSSLRYCWHHGATRWSRPHARRAEAVAAMRAQGFGAYVDTDGARISLGRGTAR